MITPKPNTCIHVKTQAEYDEFAREAEETGLRWCNNEKLSDRNAFIDYGSSLCIDISGNELSYGNIYSYQNKGYTIEEYRPEFRVGDTVEIKVGNIYKDNLKRTHLVTRLVSGNKPNDSGTFWELETINWEDCPHCGNTRMNTFWKDGKYITDNYKLISRAEEPKPVEKGWIEDNKYGIHYYATSITINKPNKKTFMSNIVEFAKNQALKATNPDEFALRTAGLKDQEGNWTADAIQIVKDLKAQQLGYKDANEANIKTATVPGTCGVSFIEAENIQPLKFTPYSLSSPPIFLK